MNEVDICIARLVGEEEYKQFPYDDATDLPVKAPVGNVTVGYGFNVQAGVSQSLALSIMKLQVQEVQTAIQGYPWYVICDPVRRSVLLDIGFNDGIEGLLGFPKMEAALEAGNWAEAAAQCQVANPELKTRYENLANLLLIGGGTVAPVSKTIN